MAMPVCTRSEDCVNHSAIPSVQNVGDLHILARKGENQTRSWVYWAQQFGAGTSKTNQNSFPSSLTCRGNEQRSFKLEYLSEFTSSPCDCRANEPVSADSREIKRGFFSPSGRPALRELRGNSPKSSYPSESFIGRDNFSTTSDTRNPRKATNHVKAFSIAEGPNAHR